MANDTTVREAMVSQALGEIDELIDKLDSTKEEVKDLCETVSLYFEDTSNRVADMVQKSIASDLKQAKNRLDQSHKQLSENIEAQRKATVTLNHLINKYNNINTTLQSIIYFFVCFFGALLGGSLAIFIFL